MEDVKQIALGSDVKAIQDALAVMKETEDLFNAARVNLKGLTHRIFYEIAKRERIIITDSPAKYEKGVIKLLNAGFEVEIHLTKEQRVSLAYEMLKDTKQYEGN